MKRVLVVLMVAALATAAQAWTLLDDFEGYATGDTATATGGVWSTKVGETGTSEITASGSGQVLQINKLAGDSNWDGSDRNLTGTGAAIAVAETQTYFWQVNVHTDHVTTSWTYDIMMGLAPETSNIDQVNAWQDFAVMPYVNNAASTPFINADAPGTFWAPMSPDTWTNVWVVINNDAVDPTFALYYSTGTDAPVLVTGDANWRNHAAGVDLNAIGFMASGWDLSNYQLDNIYYAEGVDLTNPIPEPATLILLGLGSLTMLRKRK